MELSKLLTIQNGRYVNQVCAAELSQAAWYRAQITKGRAWTGFRRDLIGGIKLSVIRARMARKEAQRRRIGVHGI
jgi:hypothetical protein